MVKKNPTNTPFLLIIGMEVLIIILFAVATEYSPDLMAIAEDTNHSQAMVLKYYPFFQDIHVMIFIGFGFLMVFLKSHSWTSVSYNLLIAAMSLQIAILSSGVWHGIFGANGMGKIQLDITSPITGDFGAAAVLITFGAVLGKVDSVQMIAIAVIELIFWGMCEAIGTEKLGAVDMGGSVYIHTFGAYFGVACAVAMGQPKVVKVWARFEDGNYVSQLTAMVGTVFLFCFWPSFNCVLAGGNSQMRVVINTTLALTASVICAFGMSSHFNDGLFGMEDVLNATLAGGVIVGATCDMYMYAWQPLLLGGLGG